MKKLTKLFASVALTFLLSASTFAGDGIIVTMNTEPTPPPTSVTTANTTTETTETDGIIYTGFTVADSTTTVALSLLQSVLALF